MKVEIARKKGVVVSGLFGKSTKKEDKDSQQRLGLQEIIKLVFNVVNVAIRDVVS